MTQISAQQLKNKWNAENGPADALNALYSEGLQQYWDWLGDTFYPLFGIDDFGLAQPADLPTDATQKELDYYIAAKDLSYKLNSLNQNVFDIERGPELASLASGDWPGDDLTIYDYTYYRGTIVPVFVNIVEDLKAIEENILISAPDGFNDSFGSGPFAWGKSPPEDLPELIESVIDAAEEFLKNFPDVGISFKKDLPAPTSTSGLGPSPIFSDSNLESSLQFQTGQTHYIGLLLNPEKSNGSRSKPYLPVRVAPNIMGDKSPPLSPRGWQDPDYYLIDHDGEPVKSSSKIDNGIEVPLGLEITITEVVQSETGVWVGFVSDDPRLEESIFSDISWDDITNEQTRVIYTKSHFVRIKEKDIFKNPDPYISQLTKFAVTGEEPSTQALKVKGASPFDPLEMNWVTRLPNDVSLEYYSFWNYNKDALVEGNLDNLFFNVNTLETAPTLRYSEGYFYFITGEAPRKSEAELINEDNEDLESAKAAAGATSIESIKREAWNNLLMYLGKNTEGGNSLLYESLYEKYFVLAASKLHTDSVNPNNQKALFAIRSQYIDSLPDTRASIGEFFNSDSPFLSGRSFSTSMKVKDIKNRTKDLVGDLKTIKSKAGEQRVQNANGTDYDFDAQIEALEKLPDIIDDFMRRQAYPNSSQRSFIYEMAGEGIETPSEHVIQIGIKDNLEIGENVRETISYVLFAPDVSKIKTYKLRGFDVGDSNLYYFDPYLKGEDVSEGATRSAVPLNVGLNLLRSKLEGKYFSRALHLLLSYPAIRPKLQKAKLDIQSDKWMEYLSQFVVPPVKIFLSKLPDPLIEEEDIDCEELIEKINKAGPNSTREDRLLQEKLYNSPKCMEVYYNKFRKDTHAGSPKLSKKELENLGTKLGGGSKGQSMSAETSAYLNLLYTSFFNVLDMDAIIAMIMACLSKKLGISFTAEAICEAAIIELIKNIGPSPIEQAMLANALVSPDSEASQNFLAIYQGAPPFVKPGSPAEDKFREELVEEGLLTIDSTFEHAPIASSLLMAKKPSGIVKLVKELEKGGSRVNLIPGKRPQTSSGYMVPYGSAFLNFTAGEEMFYNDTYTIGEIEAEKKLLKSKGYNEQEAEGLLIQMGYLEVDPVYYEGLLNGDDHSGPADRFVNKIRENQFSGAVNVSAAEDVRAITKDAENWLNYMKGMLGLQGLCELIVGDILDGLKDLIKDPGAFFSGGAEGWWEDFKEKLKKQFTPPPMTFKWPDGLMTDSHMGDYEKQLAKMIIVLVTSILGQIVSLLIKDALEKCLEEEDDIGPGGRPMNKPADIPLPVIQRANLPTIDGIPDVDIVAWMKDIVDNLKTAQLCALLQGNATEQTLRAVLARTKSNWFNIYLRGIDTIYEIRVAFQKIGESLNLDICEVGQSSPIPLTLISNICDAFYDRDSRCEQLKLGGLTEEECQKQIDRELDDLRKKVISLTSMSLFNMAPLSNSLPPVCGEGGSFVVPPGVRDTMERITDNMLTALKGSLMIDMNALKFFSTPPRALMAMSDPEELMNLHGTFIEAVKNPYKLKCLAVVSDPWYLQNNFEPALEKIEIYPMVYDAYTHYGNFSTWRARDTDFEVSGITAAQEEEAQQKAEQRANTQRDLDIENAMAAEEAKGGYIASGLGTIKTDMILNLLETNKKRMYAVGAKRKKWNRIYDALKLETAAKVSIIDYMVFLLGEEGVTTAAAIIENVSSRINTYQFWEEFDGEAPFGGWYEIEVVKPVGAYGDMYTSEETNWETGEVTTYYTKINGVTIEEWVPSADYMLTLYAHLEDLYQEAYDARIGGIDAQFELNLVNFFIEEKDKYAALVQPEQIENSLILDEEQIKEDVYNRWNSNWASGPTIKKDNFFEREMPMPLNVASIIKEGQWSAEDQEDFENYTGNQDVRGKTARNAFVNRYNPADPGDLSLKIINEFEKDQKPTYLDTLIVPFEHLIRPPGSVGGLLANGKNVNGSAGFPGHINNNNKSDMKLRRSFTLDTKLKDISPNPNVWYHMLRAYTGCLVTTHAEGFWARLLPDFLTTLSADVLDTFDPDNFTGFIEDLEAEEGAELVISASNSHDVAWYNWLVISPGMRKIVARALERREADESREYKDEHHEIALAFMELTLAEATGLEQDRLSKIFPNLSPTLFSNSNLEIVLGRSWWQKTTVLKKIANLDAGTHDIIWNRWPGHDPGYPDKHTQYYPHFIVFDKYFRDPKSILNKGESEVIDYFSGDNDIVNKELYDYLSNEFPLSLGSGTGLGQMGNRHTMAQESFNLENDKNFNPNILKYDLPFTEVSIKGAAGVDTNAVVQQITQVFSSVEGNAQAAEIANNISLQSLNRDLIYQNVASLNVNPMSSQAKQIRDMSRMIKAAVRNLPQGKNFPPNVISGDGGIEKQVYDFDYADDFDADNILSTLYGPGTQQLKNIIEKFNASGLIGDDYYIEKTLISDQDKPFEKVMSRDGTGFLEPFNLKAQIFADLLTHKFSESFLEHYDPSSISDEAAQFVEDNQEDFNKHLRNIFSTYGYSSLQYAYSTQMFTKLKHSRLHRRSFMKKLWNKILQSPVTSDVDPRCQDLFDQLSAPSTKDIDKVETDFFRLENVKPMIIEFYEKSLCYDVYEKNKEGDNAARISLLEGMVLLVAKIYSLEMCLASLIAWDSFNYEEVLKDKTFISVIMRNISEDFDLQFINFFATDILKKDLGLTPEELAQNMTEQSSIEYLVRREAENISAIISSMFNNSSRLSTDLSLNMLKNSDPDFVREASILFPDAEKEDLAALSTIYESFGIEIVHDARFDNNIYTMNYGSSQHKNYFTVNHFSNTQTKNSSDIFGHFGKNMTQNKDFLHSAPLTYHIREGGYTTKYDEEDLGGFFGGTKFGLWKNKTSFGGDPLNSPGEYSYFQKMHSLQHSKTGFLRAGALSKENISENTYGNNMNAKLGNVTFQPYVKIEDWEEGDQEREKYTLTIYSEYNEDGSPCDGVEALAEVKLSDLFNIIEETIEAGRQENGNIIGGHIHGVVSLSAWDYYYTNTFLRTINNYSQNFNGVKIYPLKELWRKYGLKPFFKKVKFGMRMMYSTSYPVSQSPALNFDEFMNNAFSPKEGSENNLKNAKCLMGQRPYLVTRPNKQGGGTQFETKVLSEIQIPIISHELEIKIIDGEGLGEAQFTVGESDAYSINELGHGPTNVPQAGTKLSTLISSGTGENFFRSMVENSHQFYYKNLANDFLNKIKETSEFKLMFDHLFPMTTYMSLASVLASDGLSKFISEPTIVLEETKETLKMIIDNLMTSADYQHVPDPVMNFLSDFAVRNEGGTTGKDTDLTKEILKIIFRTPLLILKGFVEVTDPAIIVAKLVIDIANTIAMTTLSAIKTGIRIAKQNMEIGIKTAEQAMMMIEMNLNTSLGPAKAAKNALPIVGTEKKALGDFIHIQIEPGDPVLDSNKETLWKEPKFFMESLPYTLKSEMSDEELDAWNSFKKQFDAMKDLVKEYATAAATLEDLKKAKSDLETELEEKVKEAEEILKDVFQSPFLLPGLWAALFPPMFPLGGGIVPPPFPGGPFPSTVPGMIYLALLLIDAIEEKTHNDLNKLGSEPNCEDEL